MKPFACAVKLWVVFALTSLSLLGAEPTLSWPDEKIDTWNGFIRHSFTVDGCTAWVVEPQQALPGRPWSWCMEFPDAFTDRCAAPQLLRSGFYHAHISVGNTFGCPDAIKHFNAFYESLTAKGLAKKATLIGISRGGLYAFRWASENPERVAAIYGDAPVCDFKSWPGGRGAGKGSSEDWKALLAAYGFKDDAEASAYRGNPIDVLAPLAKAGVSLILVVGDADDVVPVAENAAIIEERYKKLGGAIQVIHKPDVGHHPHGLDDPTPVVKFILSQTGSLNAADTNSFVRVSPRDSRYFELADGRPYIPIGLNLIAPDTRDAEGLARMEEWITKLSDNGGNYIRVWASSPFWDIEHEKSGVYDESKAQRLDAVLKIAARHGVKVKLTLEHFREMSDQPQQRWANKPLHLISNGGTATNVADFFSGEASRDRFRQKLAWLSHRYGDNPTIYGWELWNEVNAVKANSAAFMPWTETMLAELHKQFPRNLALQSLGSYDTQGVRALYRQHSLLPGNDVAQVHRYLDLGAQLDVCHGPVDVLASDAVRDLLSFDPKRPVVLAESGAVEPSHAGPFKLYAKDKDGVLLHDILFAPFFSGAAGAGQVWHWDVYVNKNNLWWQFARFAAAVKDVDPATEAFQVKTIPHERLRIYVLQGRKTVLVWCRDSKNTWRTELEEGQPPEMLHGLTIDLSSVLPDHAKLECYDPWNDQWSNIATDSKVALLPTFSRSLVVRATTSQ